MDILPKENGRKEEAYQVILKLGMENRKSAPAPPPFT